MQAFRPKRVMNTTDTKMSISGLFKQEQGIGLGENSNWVSVATLVARFKAEVESWRYSGTIQGTTVVRLHDNDEELLRLNVGRLENNDEYENAMRVELNNKIQELELQRLNAEKQLNKLKKLF